MTRARALVAFLLCFHAAAHASLALGGASPVLTGATLAGAAVVMALAALAGARFDAHADETPEVEREQRGTRVTVAAVYAVVLLGALLPPGPRGVLALVACQVVFASLPQLGPGRGLMLVNAQVMACLGVLAGGVVAATSILGHGLLVVAWLALDQARRRDLPLARAMRGAVLPALACTLLLVAGLALVRPAAWKELDLPGPRTGAASRSTARLVDAYSDLVLYAAAGLAILLVAMLVLPREEAEGEEKPLPAPPPRVVIRRAAQRPPGVIDESGDRGRVIAAHRGFLARAAMLGRARAPHRTPAEFAAGLPPPASELARLFGRARWSRERISPVEASAAEAHAAEALATIAAAKDAPAKVTSGRRRP